MLRSGVSPVSKVLLRQQNVSTQGTLRLKSTLPGLPVFAPKKVDNGAGSQFLRQWYRVFGSSNAMYLSWIVIGVIVAEWATVKIRDTAWNSINHGRTWETTDWSKFRESVVEEEDDEEEEEEEEAEEEEEEEEE